MRQLLAILIFLLSHSIFSQIKQADIEKAKLHADNFRANIDSLVNLKNGWTLYYASDSIFKSMYLSSSNGKDIEIDLRYKDNYKGYTKLGIDFEGYVLFKERGDGSGNPIMLRVVDKNAEKVNILGNYPFYLNKEKEIAVYESSAGSDTFFVIHNFQSNKKETYPIPDTNCICCDCWEMIKFNESEFTVKYKDKDNQTIFKVVKRK